MRLRKLILLFVKSQKIMLKYFSKKVFHFEGVSRLLYRRGGDVNATEKEKTQNRELIAGVYEQYKNYMYALAGKYAADPRDCDDIVQDTVIRLLQNAHTLERLEDGHLAAYINLTVRSAALDFFDRRNSRSKYVVSEPYDQIMHLKSLEELGNTVEEVFFKNERDRAVHNAMQRVPERFRLLLIGKYYLCLEDNELLAFRGCQRQSLRSLMSRARRMLQKELEKEGLTDDRY